MFLGYADMNGTFFGVAIVRTSLGVPVDPDTAPFYQVYGPDGLRVPSASGTLARLDPRPVTAAVPATPVQITSAAHGLRSGMKVVVSGVGGVTGANGSFQVTVVDANTFHLDGSVGSGAYTSGGQWSIAGAFTLAIPTMGSSGYERGESYTVLVSSVLAGSPSLDDYSFLVN